MQPGLLLKIPQNGSLSNSSGEQSAIVIHTVQKGESLWDIAQQYHSSLELLSKVNELKEPNSLYIGQEVKVPLNNNEIIKEINIISDGKTTLSFRKKIKLRNYYQFKPGI